MSAEQVQRDAMRRAHLHERIALRAAAALVSADIPQRALLLAVAEQAALAVEAAACRVTELRSDGDRRVLAQWVADPADAARPPRGPASPGATDRRPDGSAPGASPAGPQEGRRTEAAIRFDGLAWGALDVAWSAGATVPSGAEDCLARFADLLTLVVGATAAREHRVSTMYVDDLTGLENQRGFADRLAQEMVHAAQNREPLGVVVLDIDHFGQINAQHGHEVGDEVLREVARRLRAIRRSGDLLARIGGEEFAWVLPAADDLGLVEAAERARSAIADVAFDRVGTVRVSAGVCGSADVSDARHLVRRAELALHRAKSTGRDAAVRYSADIAAIEPGERQWDRLESERALAAIRALAGAVDAKDPSTQRHSERVAALVGRLARTAGWSVQRAAALYSAGLVHDVGKIGVPERILLKPGRLTAEEYEVIKTHAARGAEIVADLLPTEQVEWIRHHHERHDGRGYPDGVEGHEISEGARLLALADAWDAMTGARPYSTPRTTEDAISEVRRQNGSQFSPEAVDALLVLHRQGVLDELAAERAAA